MKRLAVLLAFTAMGTGCVSHDTCDSHTVVIAWPTFTVATQTGYATTAACDPAYAAVAVYVDGDPTGVSTTCQNGSIPFTLLTGDHSVRVEAIDSSGIPFVRDERTFHVSDSCSTQVVNTNPGESVVTIDYAVPGGACVAGSVMWFRVDDPWGPIAEVDETSSGSVQDNFPCGSPVRFVVPAGDLVLQRIEEVTFPTASTFLVQSGFCTPTGFHATSGVDTTSPPVDLVDLLACHHP